MGQATTEKSTDEFADRKPQSACGSETAWSVEARSFDDGHPVVLSERLIFTSRWKTVPFDSVIGGKGIPSGHPIFDTYVAFGLLSYPAAQALRWWFLADLEQSHKSHGIQTRLVKHEVKYQRSAQRVSAHSHLDGMNVLRCEDAKEPA